ncbi:MAG TPA: lipid-binding SYLF domain-containing protein [Candidatus Methylomirabilis sp.]|nr:lipid-binding SYLF domain-containing protein [Candidatus Methylomirabilis sp.]
MKKLVVAAICLATALSAIAQEKLDKRIAESTTVLANIIDKPNGIPRSLLDKAECVLVYPGVKKVGVGIGVGYGRGVLLCRSGKAMDGNWGAPVMYTLDTSSLGAQLGTTSTDYVLLVMSQIGADKVLSGKLKLGSDATAAAGPAGAQAAGFNDPKVDILTYSQTKGLFAGASLGNAAMGADNKADQELYGKTVDAMEIIRGDVPVPATAKSLVDMLNKVSPKHK